MRFLILFCLMLGNVKAQERETKKSSCNATDIIISANYRVSTESPLQIDVFEIRDLRMTVFDGAGHKLHEVEINITYTPNDVKESRYFKQVDIGWKGDKDMHGNEVEGGMYYYAIDGECMNGNPVRKTGSFVLTKPER